MAIAAVKTKSENVAFRANKASLLVFVVFAKLTSSSLASQMRLNADDSPSSRRVLGKMQFGDHVGCGQSHPGLKHMLLADRPGLAPQLYESAAPRSPAGISSRQALTPSHDVWRRASLNQSGWHYDNYKTPQATLTYKKRKLDSQAFLSVHDASDLVNLRIKVSCRRTHTSSPTRPK